MLFTRATFVAYLLAIGEERAQTWWDYPGLELWKFFNLFVFVAGLMYVVKRSFTDAFRSRRKSIRRDLLRAQEERDQAFAKLAEVQSRLTRLDSEVAGIQGQARVEVRAERERIVRDTDLEVLKLRDQARREVLSADKVARHDLRLFAAERCVRLAEGVIRDEIGPEDDKRLVDMNVEQMGRG